MSLNGAHSYPEIRGILAHEYRALPDESIEALVEESFGSASAEDVESFLKGLKKIGSVVGKALPTVLPVVGTVAGTAFGGPLGAKLGGMAGRLAGGAIGRATAGGAGGRRGRGGLPRLPFRRFPGMIPPRPAAGGRVGTAPAVAAVGGAAVAAAPAAPAAAGAPAASQLLSVLNRPEIMQALLAMTLGQAGSSHIPVGDEPVPVGAFANMIGTLANQAANDHQAADPAAGEAVPSYLLSESGEFLVDPAVPEERAQLLLAKLNESALWPDSADEAWDEASDEYEPEGDEFAEDDEFYDLLEMSEAYEAEY